MEVIPCEKRLFGKLFRSFLIPEAGTHMPLNADKQVEGGRNLHIGTQDTFECIWQSLVGQMSQNLICIKSHRGGGEQRRMELDMMSRTP